MKDYKGVVMAVAQKSSFALWYASEEMKNYKVADWSRKDSSYLWREASSCGAAVDGADWCGRQHSHRLAYVLPPWSRRGWGD